MFRHHHGERPAVDRTSLYDAITSKIIAELEAGRVPWVQPWGTANAKTALAVALHLYGAIGVKAFSRINLHLLVRPPSDHLLVPT